MCHKVKSPLISIIVATYNSASTIERCLESIARQVGLDVEVIVVDGKSADDTLSIVNSFSSKLPIILSSESDDGVYDAWNRGLGLASGDWLTFLGSDDIYLGTDGLAKLLAAGSARPDVPFAYSRLASVGAKGELIHIHGETWRDPFSPYQQYVTAQFPFPTMGSVYRRSFLGSDLFNDSYRIAGDLEFFLRRFKQWRGSSPVFVPVITVEMSVGGISTNDAHFRRALAEDFRFRRDLGMTTFNLGLWSNVVKRAAMMVVIKLLGRKFYEDALRVFRNARANIRGISPR